MGKLVQLRETQTTPVDRTRKDRLKLTKRLVQQIEPKPNIEVFVWDSELPGFGVRVMPSGVRTYFIQYRNPEGRTRRLVLGRHGVLTAEQAREAARQQLVDVSRGADPSASRRAARGALTVSELCDRYLQEHAAAHKKASSVREDRRLIDSRIKPAFGPQKAEAIKAGDVMKLHHSLRKTPYEGNRTLALLSKVFNLAEAWGLRSPGSNPCRTVQRYPERKRERFLSTTELAQLGTKLLETDGSSERPTAVVTAVKLLALTGCRRSEILNLRWEDVDLDARVLRLRDAKAGPRDVPLGRAAGDVLAKLTRTGLYVVAGSNPEQPFSASTLEDGWYRLCKAAGLSNARLHDLRHTVGTYGGHSGANAFLVRDLLGHRTLATTARYVERNVDPVLAVADEVSSAIAGALGFGKSPEAKR